MPNQSGDPIIRVRGLVNRFGSETVHDGLDAEPVDEPAHADDRLSRLDRHVQICNAEKKIENTASVTITRKIASTTDVVVRRPTLSALRST